MKTTPGFLSLLAAALAAVAAPARAQTWNGLGGANGNGTYNWNNPANWSPTGIPASTASTAILLTGTTGTATNQNIAPTFTLNSLVLDSADSAGSFSVAGNALMFAGANANITLTDYRTGSPASNQLRIDSAIVFSVDTAIVMTSSAGTNPVGYELSLNGALSGAGNVTVRSATTAASDFLIAGRNSAMTGSFTIDPSAGSVAVYLGGVNALNRGVTLNSGSSSFSGIGLASYVEAFSGVTAEKGYDQQLGNLTGSAALSIGSFGTGFAAQQSATLALGFANADASYAGVVRFATAASHLAKVGTGVFTGTGSMGSNAATVADLSVRDGRYAVSGNGTLGSTAPTPTGASSLRVYGGAEFRSITGTSTAGKVQNNAAINLAGGVYRLDASGLAANTSGYSDVVGVLTAVVGQSTVAVDTNSARTSRWSFTSLSATPGATATLFFLGKTFGANALSSGIDSASANFGSTPNTLVGGTSTYSPTATNVRILPYGFAALTPTGTPGSYTGTPETFVAYDATAGSIRRLEDTNYAGGFGTAADNVSLAADASTGTATANSLRITGSTPTLTLGSGTLNLASGALLTTGLSIVSGPGILAFGNASGNGTAFITNTLQLSVGAPVFAANLSKNGAGQLQFGGLVTLTATNPVIGVNAGSLQFNTGAVATGTPLSASNVLTYQVAKGATLALTSPLAIDGFKVLQGAGSVPGGTVTVSGGGTIRPSALGGPTATLASPATLSVTSLAFGPGGTYEWYLNSVQGGPYTQSLLAGAGPLNITATNANAASKFTIRITSLALSNAVGPVYDYDGGSYQWTIATYDGGIAGFAADKFILDTSGATFAGSMPNLTIATSGNSLVLIATPVPEPAGLLALAGLGLAAVRRIRNARRRGATNPSAE